MSLRIDYKKKTVAPFVRDKQRMKEEQRNKAIFLFTKSGVVESAGWEEGVYQFLILPLLLLDIIYAI